MIRYYDRQGKPIANMLEWAKLMGDPAYQRVRHTQINGEVRVSTVWLGLDHNMMGDGPSLIFETMVFGGEHDQEMERYSTEEEACAGHERMVDLATNTFDVDFRVLLNQQRELQDENGEN